MGVTQLLEPDHGLDDQPLVQCGLSRIVRNTGESPGTEAVMRARTSVHLDQNSSDMKEIYLGMIPTSDNNDGTGMLSV